MLLLPNRHLSILEVWRYAVNLWKISIRKVLPFTVLFGIVAFLPYFFFSGVDPIVPFATNLQTLAELIIFAIYALLVLFFVASGYQIINHTILGKKWSYNKVIASSLMLLSSLILGLVIYTATLFFGLAFLIVPGIFFAVALTPYYPLMILDDLSPINAFGRSLDLVRGHWWQTAITVWVPFLVFWVGVSIIQFFTIGLGLDGLPTHLSVASWYASGIFEVLWIIFYFPFSLGLILLQLHNLKLSKVEEVSVLPQPASG